MNRIAFSVFACILAFPLISCSTDNNSTGPIDEEEVTETVEDEVVTDPIDEESTAETCSELITDASLDNQEFLSSLETVASSSNLNGTWLLVETSIDYSGDQASDNSLEFIRHKVVRIIDNMDGTGSADFCFDEEPLDISYDEDFVLIDGMSLINENNSLLTGSETFETILLAFNDDIISSKNTDRDFRWVKLSNDNISTGHFIHSIFDDEGNSIIESVHSDIQCFISAKGSFLAPPQVPAHGFMLAIESSYIGIQGLSGEKSIDFWLGGNDSISSWAAWESGAIDRGGLSIEAHSEGYSDHYRAKYPNSAISGNKKNNVFLGEFQSMSNELGDHASGCFRALN